MKSIKIFILVFLLSSLCLSCADIISSTEVNSGLRSELNDRGRIKLDPSNPYVAPNAFLAEEAKRSDNLKGFLSIKGNPNALSYHESFFGDPELSLYYEDKGELYNLKQKGKDWIISSPSKTEIKDEKSSSDSSSLFREEPPIVTYLDPKLEEARIKASGTTKGSDNKGEGNNKEGSKEPTTTNNTASVSSEFKDIYHIVEYEGQNLEFIAYWYTGSIENVERIAGINGTDKKVPLRLSQSIRIPSYLAVKQDKPTEKDLKSFLLGR